MKRFARQHILTLAHHGVALWADCEVVRAATLSFVVLETDARKATRPVSDHVLARPLAGRIRRATFMAFVAFAERRPPPPNTRTVPGHSRSRRTRVVLPMRLVVEGASAWAAPPVDYLVHEGHAANALSLGPLRL